MRVLIEDILVGTVLVIDQAIPNFTKDQGVILPGIVLFMFLGIRN